MFQEETLEQARARNIREALAEDIGRCDWTAQLVPAGRRVAAQVRVREPAVLCGRDWFDGVFAALDASSRIEWLYDEGAQMAADTLACRIEADGRLLLSAERPALNFLQLLSGTATVTRAHVDAVAGASTNPNGCAILDTRKTIPGLRVLDKYAARMGGAENHRMRLDDGLPIKDNHVAVAGGVAQAVRAAKAANSGLKVQVEVDRIDQIEPALHAGADRLLLDNMPPPVLREAVALVARRVPLEASGGVNLETIRGIAETGVNYISVGRITQSAPAVDIGLDYSLKQLGNDGR